MTVFTIDRAGATSPTPTVTAAGSLNLAPGFIVEPLEFDEGQLFYRTSRWQSDEAQSEEDLAAGRYRMFESADEAIRWLVSSDD